MITCAADVTIECDESTDPSNTGEATATDNCDATPTISSSDSVAAGTCPQESVITRTWTATDDCGNGVTCEQIITVEDTTDPTITCPADIEVDNDFGVCGAVVDFTPTARDNCGLDTVICIPPSGSFFDLGTTLVTCTATDLCGNSEQCSFDVTVNDAEDPVINCPADVTVECDESTDPSNTGEATSTDNCESTGDPIIECESYDGEFFIPDALDDDKGTEIIPGKATAEIIISASSLCLIQDINVTVDIEFFEGMDQFGISLRHLETGTEVLLLDQPCDGFTCPGPSFIYDDEADFLDCESGCEGIEGCPCLGASVVPDELLAAFIGEEAAGTWIICITDYIPSYDNEAELVEWCIEIEKASGDIITFSDSVSPEDCPQELVITRTWTATDASGNSDSCDQIITVEDTMPPSISCPADVTLECPADISVGANGTATGSDNCDSVTISSSDDVTPGCGGTETITRTWTATDDCGNATTCDQIITVLDTTPPVITCPADVTLECPADTTTANTGTATGSDTCGDVAITSSDLPVAGCGGTETITRTWTATDDCGNATTCDQIITVEDNTPPEIMCPADVTLECPADTEPESTGEATGSDTCGDVTISSSDSVTPGCAGTETITRTWTATDDCGNTSTCDQIITVEDTTLPLITCPADVTLECPADTDPEGTGEATGSDTCGDVSISSSDASSPGCGNTEVITRTWTATDECGNEQTCDQTITVEDTTDPTIACPADITVGNDPGACGAIVTFTATADDDCGLDDVVCTPASGSFFLVGTTQVSCTATDLCGNTQECSFNVTVEDTELPTILCRGDDIVANDPGQCGAVVIFDVTPEDNCPGVTFVCDATSGAFFPVGSTIVTCTATDTAGNTAVCQFMIPVEDFEPPTALCQDVTIQLDESGQASITTEDIDAGSDDNCGILSLSLDQTEFDCSHLGANTVTLTVTDTSGNQDTCTATVTVEDNVPPVAVCQAVTIQLDANGQASITTGQINGESSDNCGIANLSLNQTEFDCSHVGFTTVDLTVTDTSGNATVCTAVITVEDNVAPTAVCQDITVQLDASGNASITGDDIDNGSNDACGIASLDLDDTDFTCADIGPNTVTLTVTDNNENSSSCTATVTVEDNVAPEAICQDATVQLDASGNGSITTGDIDNGSNDACGIASLNLDDTDFTCADVGPNTVTLTVTDNNGNSSSCTASVTVEDNVDPTAICQDVTVQLDASGNGSITTGDIDNGSNDACGIASLNLDNTDFTCADVGANTVTLTVTDNNENSSTCTATVTVEDNVDPTALCQDATVQLDATGNGSITANDIDTESNDACGIASLTVAPDAFTCTDVGENTVTLTVTDNNGNSSSCTATVTVEDNIAPVALCQNLTIQLDATGQGSITPQDIDNGSSDNCAVDSLSLDQTEFDCNDVGQNTVILTVTDPSGNESSCSAVVTVEDDTSPTAVCQNVTIQLDGSGQASLTPQQVDNGSSDNCSVANLSIDQTEFNCSHLGANTVTLTVIDPSENEDSCTATITVEDNIAPTAVCQDLTIQLNAGGNANITPQQVDNGSSDNCGVETLSLSQTAFDCSEVGANTVTLTVTDSSGNEDTCTATVTVEDNIDPTITCPADITTDNDPGQCGAFVTYTTTGNDNCPGFTVTCDPPSGNFFAVGGTTVNCTATDASGNTAQCSFTVTVNDTEDPTMNCPGDIVVSSDEGQAGAVVIYASPVGIDNCPGSTTVQTTGIGPGNFFPIGATVETYEVTDVAGNIATCSFTVTVNDIELPTISCPADITVESDPEVCGAVVTYTAPVGSDNQSGATTVQIEGIGPGGFFPVGTTTETYEVTDIEGNSTECSFSVTVNDNELPTIGCPEDTTVDNDAGQCGATVTYTEPIGSDNCTGSTSVQVAGLGSGSFFPIGSTVETFEVTDASGNSDQCSFTVTVNDIEDPTITCPADITVSNDSGQCSAVVTYNTPVGQDNCPNANTTQTAGLGSGSTFPVGTTTETYEVTDAAGNTATCSFTVTVNDTEDPTITCPADITVDNDPGECDAVVTYTEPTGSDNCPGAVTNRTNGLGSGGTFQVGTTTETYEVTDGAGNTTACSFIVTVNDTEDPTITCPANITVNNDPGQCSAVVSYNAPVGQDNCPDANTTQTAGLGNGSTFPVGTTTETYEVTDAAGNTATCSFTVTVNDTEDPTITCPADITVSNDEGQCSRGWDLHRACGSG